MKKVAIVGSRDFADLEFVADVVHTYHSDMTWIISGNARGVDQAAQAAALRAGIPVLIFPAQWEVKGRGAGFIRNQQIVDEADQVIAFWDGKSRGTLDTIHRAIKADKLRAVLKARGKEWDEDTYVP